MVKVQNVHNGYNIYDNGNFLEAKDKCKFVTELQKIDVVVENKESGTILTI